MGAVVVGFQQNISSAIAKMSMCSSDPVVLFSAHQLNTKVWAHAQTLEVPFGVANRRQNLPGNMPSVTTHMVYTTLVDFRHKLWLLWLTLVAERP